MGDVLSFTGPPPLQILNQNELLELVYIHRGVRLRHSTSPERLIQLIENPQEQPRLEELPASTLESRQLLETWILKNWEALKTQLPCKGHNYGHCTVFPCTEARHISCWMEVKGRNL